tara:strand:- start:199 stop:429 length:231 start_codon:yes stop_codon:yes gene_type:complete
VKITKTRLRQIIKEELQVILTNEEAADFFGDDVLEQLEDIEEEKNNPWAICTASVGRENKEKYEKCVMSVKNKRGK